jgi:SAM-dependent methyltransferase
MAINALQVAWLSRLRSKGVLSPGQSIIEFSPQDVLASRAAVERYGLRHNPPDVVQALLNEIFDGETPRPTGIPAFYRMFGVERYRSMDVFDRRADWLRDFNVHVRLSEQFDVATNFGTAEHVFNIGHVFHSMHDALRPGGVALHILPAFGDIDHGFYNIHPTTYFDVAAANGYTIEDLCYVDRWDIRNKMLEAGLVSDIEFDGMPIRIEHMKQRPVLQRMVTERFIENYKDADTQRFGADFPGVLYDYCGVALRKNGSAGFRLPMQGYYGGGVAAGKSIASHRVKSFIKRAPAAAVRRVRRYLGAVKRAVLRRHSERDGSA